MGSNGIASVRLTISTLNVWAKWPLIFSMCMGHDHSSPGIGQIWFKVRSKKSRSKYGQWDLDFLRGQFVYAFSKHLQVSYTFTKLHNSHISRWYLIVSNVFYLSKWNIVYVESTIKSSTNQPGYSVFTLSLAEVQSTGISKVVKCKASECCTPHHEYLKWLSCPEAAPKSGHQTCRLTVQSSYLFRSAFYNAYQLTQSI